MAVGGVVGCVFGCGLGVVLAVEYWEWGGGGDAQGEKGVGGVGAEYM